MSRSSATSSDNAAATCSQLLPTVLRGLLDGGRRSRGCRRAPAPPARRARRVPFGVRIGLHTGEATERRSRLLRPRGEPRRAADVDWPMAGRSSCPTRPRCLLRNRLALRPLGEHRLRGLGRRMAVHQIVADGLPSEFPPLRSLGPFAGNLPRQLSSFVGRDQLLADVADLVRSNRLVTLEWRRAASARRGSPSRSAPRWPTSSPTASGWSSSLPSVTLRRCPPPSRPRWASRRRATPN